MVLVRTTGPTPPRPGSLPDRRQSVLDMLALIQVEKKGEQPQLSQKLRLLTNDNHLENSTLFEQGVFLLGSCLCSSPVLSHQRGGQQ